MIITRTPFRVSFAGGGSDLKEFYARNGYGAVIGAAIRKYMYIVIHPYFQDKIRIKYSRTEDVESAEEVEHPLVRESLKKVKIEKGIEIASFADVSAGTGLGSSSAFTVGLLHALYAYKGKRVSRERLAKEACEIEIDILGEPIGKQDQYMAAYGGVNHIKFNGDGSVKVSPVGIKTQARKKLEKNLYLYYIGGSRKSGDILEEQMNNMSKGDKFENMRKMVDLVEKIKKALHAGDIDSVGNMLHEGWMYKKRMANGITNDSIDRIYDKFMRYGTIGGKLLGAGGAGFLLIYTGGHEDLKGKLGYKALPFNIDMEGSKVIFQDDRNG